MREYDDDLTGGGRRLRTLAETRPAKESGDAVRSGAGTGSSSYPGGGRLLALQRSAGNAAVSRLMSAGEEESPVLDVVGKGGGQPLPETVRIRMESSFGQDFSSVRLHTGSAAASSAKAVQAKAYTVGDEIVLGESAPKVDSAEGERTLAHELTHVVQQRSGPVDATPVGGGISLSDPSDRFETQAEAVADRISSGGTQRAGALVGAAPAAGAVQRAAEDVAADEETLAEDLQEEEEQEEQEAQQV